MSYSSNNDTPPTVSSDNHTIGLVTDPRGGPGSGGDVRKDPVYRVKAQLFRTVGQLGLVFDLVVVVSVAGAFSAKIHDELGTSDTSLLGGLRD
jgi:hypothetical protein